MSNNTIQRKRGDRSEFLIHAPQAPSIVAVRSVAIVTGQSHEDMQPLIEVIDPDALDTITAESKGEATVTFEYEGCVVTVATDRVWVDEAPPAGDAS